MKRILLLSLVLFSSCSYWGLYNVDSTDIPAGSGNYIYSNDTVQIVYSFWYDRGRMSFSVYNRLSVPIYIDWGNSALIVNDARLNYWTDVTYSSSSSTGYGIAKRTDYGSVGVSRGYSNTVTSRPERIVSIPPHSSVYNERYLMLPDWAVIPDGRYTSESSPFHWRNYLVLSSTDDFKNPFYTDNDFYLSYAKTRQLSGSGNKGDYDAYKSPQSFYWIGVKKSSSSSAHHRKVDDIDVPSDD